MNQTSFKLQNNCQHTLTFQVEPECHTFKLGHGQFVEIEFQLEDGEPPTIMLTELHSKTDSEQINGAIIPGDGDLFVRKDGRNV